MSATLQDAGIDISAVAGPLILGYFFMFGLFGVLTSQISDRVTTKCLVYGLYILATLQVILTFYDAIISLGFGFGNLAALSKGNLSFLAAPILTGTIALIVQVFYAYRIHVLTKWRILPLAIMQCSSGFTSGIFEVFIGDLSKITKFRRETFTEGASQSFKRVIYEAF
ncbi:hypothetical protein BDQ17DRAFT_1422528 [Cyathus striatus]|nr:hypothetical protein BDQ17DRAFT_1422528 [Cyathus striatus]